MEYRRSEYMGSYNVDEVFEGTPQEILELVKGLEYLPKNARNADEEELIYDGNDAVEFIYNKTRKSIVANWIEGYVTPTMFREIIRHILNADGEYMRSIGILNE